MKSLLKALTGYCADIAQDQYGPQRKWIWDMISGIFSSRSLMLSEIGRSLDEKTELRHIEKRLSRNLNSRRLDDKALLRRHLEKSSELTKKDDGEGVVIAVDYTDIQKPRADPEGMEGLCMCHDGSKRRSGWGFPIAQVVAHLPNENRRPLLYHLFTNYEKIGKMSQPLEFLDAIKTVAPYVGPRAWWAMDRWFDSRAVFEDYSEIGIRWIVRLKVKQNRTLWNEVGEKKSLEEVIDEIPETYRYDSIEPVRKKKSYPDHATIGSCLVRIADFNGKPCSDWKTLVVVQWGDREPFVVLANDRLPGRAGAIEIARAYRLRWKCEEDTRSLKDSREWGVRLEDLRALKFQGLQRLLILATIAFAFISELRELGGRVLDQVHAGVKTFRHRYRDPVYRLVRGLGTILGRIGRIRTLRCRRIVGG